MILENDLLRKCLIKALLLIKSQFYSYHIPSFQSYIWISPKAGFWYERQERRGVLFTLKDGVQFEKMFYFWKIDFTVQRQVLDFERQVLHFERQVFCWKAGKEGCTFHFETRGVMTKQNKMQRDFVIKITFEKNLARAESRIAVKIKNHVFWHRW